MKRYVYSKQPDKLLRIEEAEPECDKDFCDRCGDCLACYGGDECWVDMERLPEHFWVRYEDEQVISTGDNS